MMRRLSSITAAGEQHHSGTLEYITPDSKASIYKAKDTIELYYQLNLNRAPEAAPKTCMH
jgi:hypothetical protein